MTCRTDNCTQGRAPCPTPGACADDGADLPWKWIDDLAYAARWVGAALLLMLVMALSAGALVNYWPQIVAALSR